MVGIPTLPITIQYLPFFNLLSRGDFVQGDPHCSATLLGNGSHIAQATLKCYSDRINSQREHQKTTATIYAVFSSNSLRPCYDITPQMIPVLKLVRFLSARHFEVGSRVAFLHSFYLLAASSRYFTRQMRGRLMTIEHIN